MSDRIKTDWRLNDDKPVFVKVCAKCKDAFRTNSREEHFCYECDAEIMAKMITMEEASLSSNS